MDGNVCSSRYLFSRFLSFILSSAREIWDGVALEKIEKVDKIAQMGMWRGQVTEELVTAVCCKEEGDLRHPSKDQEDRRLLDRVPPRLEFWAITTQAQQRKKPSNKSIIHSLASSRLHS